MIWPFLGSKGILDMGDIMPGYGTMGFIIYQVVRTGRCYCYTRVYYKRMDINGSSKYIKPIWYV